MPFRSILCPVDFSAPSRTALRYAATVAEASGGELTVLYVDDPLLSTAAAVAYGADEITKKTDAELRKFVRAALANTGLDEGAVQLKVVVGKAAAEIVKAAGQHHADLIVMGTTGATGAARILLGSTTDTVLKKAEVPVLAVPPGARPRRSAPAAARRR
jgi:nucleotide-binding universal stress UspA family protein